MIKTKTKFLKILKYPNEKLNKKCVDVDISKNLFEIQQLIDLMFKTMNFYKGIGLAAPQIGVSYNVVVIDLHDGSDPLTLINPKIVKSEGKMESYEGCLSFPQMFGHMERSSKINIEYLDYHGTQQSLESSGLLACCIQHELRSFKWNIIY